MKRRPKRVVITTAIKRPSERCADFTVQQFHLFDARHADEASSVVQAQFARRHSVEIDSVVVTVAPEKLKHHTPRPGSDLTTDDYNEQRAIAYALWLVERDGIELSKGKTRCNWSGFRSAYRTRQHRGKDHAVYCRRVESVAWGFEEDVFNTRKDGRRGAFLYKKFVEETRVPIPNWDFEQVPPVDEAMPPCPVPLP
jgi:hypothetical protein